MKKLLVVLSLATALLLVAVSVSAAPLISNVYPLNGSIVSLNRATVSFAIAGVDAIQVTLDGEVVAPDKLAKVGMRIVVANLLEPGEHELVITVADADGQTAEWRGTFVVENYREGFGFGRLYLP